MAASVLNREPRGWKGSQRDQSAVPRRAARQLAPLLNWSSPASRPQGVKLESLPPRQARPVTLYRDSTSRILVKAVFIGIDDRSPDLTVRDVTEGNSDGRPARTARPGAAGRH